MTLTTPIVRQLGRNPYIPVWQAMRSFTDERDARTPDEIWVVEHDPVFTLGLNGKREHLLNPGDIPVVECDRGGQVTYHGPGQIVVYVLLDLRRRSLGVKHLVQLLEQAVIDLLQQYTISAQRKPNAPGVYVNGEKIAALGLRVRKGCSYHGLSLNVDMDLEPFSRINPCGFEGLQTTTLKALRDGLAYNQVTEELLHHLQRMLANPS
ncbi:MAG: lipoyl(octanoyl) transferase LipB [Gammaproteobacteria bacterium]|jgi:lipoyl(octanoyl) transferase|nr:lipoyl(octanoyl) transferase LipB [Gammaproteobacteria bacterium]